LDMKRSSSKQQLDQWDLITICAIAISRSKADTWISSFKRVNLHPDYRLNFEDWLKRIGSKIVAGEKFFKGRHTLYDMLPQFWKQMPTEDRQLAVEQIDRYHANESVETWSKQNIMELVEFVPLKDIPRLRACYLTAKRDPSVITTRTDELDQENEDQGESMTNLGPLAPYLYQQGLFPTEMLQEYKGKRGFEDGKSQDSHDVRHKWFKIISNEACNTHWGKSTEPLLPSAYLGVEISKDQLKLMNPSVGDLILSKIEEDTMGAKAKKKIARRRHDFIDGNAKSYGKILNCPTSYTNEKAGGLQQDASLFGRGPCRKRRR